MKTKEVHIGKFIGKLIACFLLLYCLIGTIAIELEDAADDASRETTAYYLDRLQDDYSSKSYYSMYELIHLYELEGEEYAKYIEICDAYHYFLLARANSRVAEADRIPEDYEGRLRDMMNTTEFASNQKIMQKWYLQLTEG